MMLCQRFDGFVRVGVMKLFEFPNENSVARRLWNFAIFIDARRLKASETCVVLLQDPELGHK